MAEGFDDFEMEDMSRKYAEDDNCNEQQLNYEYDSFLNKHLDLLKDDIEPQGEQFNIKERMNYINKM